MNLFQIDNEILECFDSETGEILDEERLNELDMNREQKLNNLIKVYKNLQSDEVQLEEQAKVFKLRAESKKKEAERIKGYLDRYLDGEKYECNAGKVSFRKSVSVNIYDMEQIPNQFIAEKVTRSPDKNMIREYIKHGEDVPGARLDTNRTMSIK